jgi:uncharacterized membrane protein YqjE
MYHEYSNFIWHLRSQVSILHTSMKKNERERERERERAVCPVLFLNIAFQLVACLILWLCIVVDWYIDPSQGS